MSATTVTATTAAKLGGMIEVYLKMKKSIEEIANHKLLLGEAYVTTTKMDKELPTEEEEVDARDQRVEETPLLEQLHQDWKLLPLHTNFITRTEIDAFDFIHCLGKPLPKVEDELLQLCKESGYGDLRTGTTKFDKSVRHAYEITDPTLSVLTENCATESAAANIFDYHHKSVLPFGASDHLISFTKDGKIFLKECLLNISDKLFLGKPIRAVFNKVNVYTEGGKFEQHVDTPRKDSIGTLVIQLDSAFTGGEFVIRPDLPPAYSTHSAHPSLSLPTQSANLSSSSSSSSSSSVSPLSSITSLSFPPIASTNIGTTAVGDSSDDDEAADEMVVVTNTTAVEVPVRIGHKENKIQAYGFYSESPHQVEEIKSGTRVTVTFWLMSSNQSIEDQEEWTNKIRHGLQDLPKSKNSLWWQSRSSSRCRVHKAKTADDKSFVEEKVEDLKTSVDKKVRDSATSDELEVFTKLESGGFLGNANGRNTDDGSDGDDDADEIDALAFCSGVKDPADLSELPVQFPQGKNDGHNFLINQLCDTIFKCKKPVGFILTHRYSNDEHLSGNYKGNDMRFIQILSARIKQLNAAAKPTSAIAGTSVETKTENLSSLLSASSELLEKSSVSAEWKLAHWPVVVHHHEESWDEDSNSNKMHAKVYRFTYEDISELAKAVPKRERHEVWESSPEYSKFERECEVKKSLDEDYYSYADHAKSQDHYWKSRMISANNDAAIDAATGESCAATKSIPVATFFGSNYWQALKTEHQSGGLTGNEAMPDMQSNHYFTNAVIVYPPKSTKVAKSKSKLKSKTKKRKASTKKLSTARESDDDEDESDKRPRHNLEKIKL